MNTVFRKRLWNGNETRVHVSDDEVIAEDYKPANQVKAILDDNAEIRNHAVPNPRANGRLVARIPDTMHREWKRDWQTKGRQDFTWQTYLAMKLNSRENSYLKLIAGKI